MHITAWENYTPPISTCGTPEPAATIRFVSSSHHPDSWQSFPAHHSHRTSLVDRLQCELSLVLRSDDENYKRLCLEIITTCTPAERKLVLVNENADDPAVAALSAGTSINLNTKARCTTLRNSWGIWPWAITQHLPFLFGERLLRRLGSLQKAGCSCEEARRLVEDARFKRVQRIGRDKWKSVPQSRELCPGDAEEALLKWVKI